MMKQRIISWEIVAAGLAFIGMAVYLLSHEKQRTFSHTTSNTGRIAQNAEVPAPPSPPPLPSTIVIDLQNLENLKRLKDLQQLDKLKNLKNIEIELQHLEQLIHTENEAIESTAQASVEQSLQDLEEKLQEIEKTEFNIQLRDRKVYINKQFSVQEASWSETSPGVFVFREAFEIAESGLVDLDLDFGNINVIGGDKANAELVLQATGEIRTPSEIQNRLAMNMNLSSDHAAFAISSKERGHLSDRMEMEATLTIPGKVNVEAKTAGGHINVSHLEGNLKLFTAGGHISLEDLTGNIVAESKGGHITGDLTRGDLELSTAGGHIKIDRAVGSISLSTGGGHVEIQELAGGGGAKTAGGNIYASITSLDRPVSFTTSAGNITLALPRSVQADLDLRGTKATVEDVFNFDGTTSGSIINGKINGGGVPVTAKCGFGNLVVKAHD